MLKGKHILVGITGGIAAYKTAALVRTFVKFGADVQVVMTTQAKQFITPLTMATLSKHPVVTEFYNPENGDWNSHVSLGLWADAYVVAPATANTLAKMANGIADNLLLTTYLSIRCPVVVAPAMDVDMWQHPATQANMQTLQKRGVHIVAPAAGELASGLEGKGRMEEPEQIAELVAQLFVKKKSFTGKTVLVTAGPTYEAIDPVRFIGNHSSGKMGYALAEVLAGCGAQVILVSGPTSLSVAHPAITTLQVTSAAEMYTVATRYFPQVNGAILCAAVADYTPEKPSAHKLKREKGQLTLALKPTADIAAALGQQKKKNQWLVGFALETDHELANAKKKLLAKNLDMIVLNSLNDKGAGFGGDTNKITIIKRDGTVTPFPLQSKPEAAAAIVDHLKVKV